jgi:hypothetical protein
MAPRRQRIVEHELGIRLAPDAQWVVKLDLPPAVTTPR